MIYFPPWAGVNAPALLSDTETIHYMQEICNSKKGIPQKFVGSSRINIHCKCINMQILVFTFPVGWSIILGKAKGDCIL
jgi:hypothetical protein